MPYSLEVAAGRTKLQEVPDTDGTVLRVVGRRAGATITYVAARVDGRWYITGNTPRTGGRTYDSVCAFFSRMTVLEAVLYVPSKQIV